MAAIVLASKFRPRARTLHAMRASLLASAIASTLRCGRFLAASIQGFKLVGGYPQLQLVENRLRLADKIKGPERHFLWTQSKNKAAPWTQFRNN